MSGEKFDCMAVSAGRCLLCAAYKHEWIGVNRERGHKEQLSCGTPSLPVRAADFIQHCNSLLPLMLVV
jgi:hypothetical protein